MPTPEQDMDLHIKVAEMHGMLTQALGDQSRRLTELESGQVVVHSRLNEKRTVLSTHSEQISNLQRAVNALEQARLGLLARVGIVLASCTGVGGMILALYNAMRIVN